MECPLIKLRQIKIKCMVEATMKFKWRFKVIKETSGRFHGYFLNNSTYQEGH